MEKSVLENITYEAGKDNLTEDQIQKIADEAIKEASGSDDKQDDWKNPADENQTGEEQRAAAAKEADDKKKEQEAKEAEDQKIADDAAAKEAADADKTDEQKQKEKEEADKVAEAAKVKEQPYVVPDREKAIQDLALKDSLTLDEAEAQIAKDEAIINKYKGNPIELAKALRNVQSYADKTKSELEATRKAATNPPAPVLNNVRDYVENQLAPIKDEVIKSFRKEYPELTDGHEDTFVYGLIKKDAIDRTMKVLEESKSKLESAAKEKRANLILSLSDQDKTYLPDIKAIIDRTNDRQLMDKSFDVNEIIYWAKGKQFDKAVKEAEERGFKRGTEQAKIIGEKTPKSNTPVSGKGTSKITLSDEQKQRAQDMFDIPGMNDQEKFDAYVETYPEEFTKR